MLPSALLIILGSLLAVVVADRLLAVTAARLVARRIAAASRPDSPPGVRISGASFLAQLAAGYFREVQVVVTGFAAGGVDIACLRARLTEVRAPLRQLLAGGSLIAGRVSASTTIALSALDSRLPQGLKVTQHGHQLRVTGSVLWMPVSGALVITAEPRRIRVTPRVLGMPSLVGFVIALPAVPPELAIDSVQVTAGGLEVCMTGVNVTLGGTVASPARCLTTRRRERDRRKRARAEPDAAARR